jgi:predicted transcriptional regulator
VTLKQKGIKVDCPAGVKIDGQAKVKRPRKALLLEKRLEIIGFWEENQEASMAEISKRFGVPRSTVYGIINSRDGLKKLAKSQRYEGMDL